MDLTFCGSRFSTGRLLAIEDSTYCTYTFIHQLVATRIVRYNTKKYQKIVEEKKSTA